MSAAVSALSLLDTIEKALRLAADLTLSVPSAQYDRLLDLDALVMGDAPALAAVASLRQRLEQQEETLNWIAVYAAENSAEKIAFAARSALETK